MTPRVTYLGTHNGSYPVQFCSQKRRETPKYDLWGVVAKMVKERGIGELPQVRGVVSHAIVDSG